MLTGIFSPLPTPFGAEGALALDLLQSNVIKLNATGLSGYLALGSNSEAVHVTPDESSQVFKAVCQSAAPDKFVFGGTGQFATQATIEMTRCAADAGCKAALVLTPFYYKGSMTGAVLRKHFETVADQSPIPIMIYNVPANTGINLGPSIVAEIARHPNVIGIKDSAGDVNQLAETVRATRGKPPSRNIHASTASTASRSPGFDVISGHFGSMLPSLTFGVAGGILAVANVAPNECVEIFNLYQQGKVAEAGELHLRILPLARAVTSQYGVPGLKAAMDRLGYFGGAPRPPLQPLGIEQRADLEKILREAGMIN